MKNLTVPMDDAVMVNNSHIEDFVFLLTEWVAPGWWDKQVHTIKYFIISKLIKNLLEMKESQDICVK